MKLIRSFLRPGLRVLVSDRHRFEEFHCRAGSIQCLPMIFRTFSTCLISASTSS